MPYDTETLENSKLWELYEDSLIEKQDEEELKQIFNIIVKFDFKAYSNSKETIKLCFQPIIRQRESVVEAQFIYTEKIDIAHVQRFLKLEMFTNGRTILTSQGNAPEILLSIVKAITNAYGKFPEDEIEELSYYLRKSFQEIF